MTKKEIIDGLKFTVDMFLLDPHTGETYTEPRNDMDKTTVDACKGAIEFLEQEPCEDCVSRQAVINAIDDDNRNGHYSCFATNNDAECFKQIIRDLPSVTPMPCEDAISRHAVIEVIRKCHCEEWVKADIGAPIEALQSVTPQPKMGYWEWVQYGGNPKIGNWHCSECRTIIPYIPHTLIYKWCPMCGAKMSEIPTGAEGSDKE